MIRSNIILLSGLIYLCACTGKVTLPDIDISVTDDGVVSLPENVPDIFKHYFVKYTKVIAPNGKPPVCKILNLGKLKYEEKKKQQQNKKKQHVIKVKEIRLRPRIDNHDLMTKLNQGRKFLLERINEAKMFRNAKSIDSVKTTWSELYEMLQKKGTR